MSENMIDLNTFANGALAARFNEELSRVLNNIQDPNTKATDARKITLTVSLKPDQERELSIVDINAKASLSHRVGVQTKMLIGQDETGRTVGRELVSGTKGQTYFDEEGVYEDTGEKLIDFKQESKKKAGGTK